MHIQNDRIAHAIERAKTATATTETSRTALDCLDYTSLSGDETPEDIQAICEKAIEHDLASVCIYPPYIELARKIIDASGKDITIATVINFDHGDKKTLSTCLATPRSTAEDVKHAIDMGARQVDIVLDYTAFQNGDKKRAQALLMACRQATPEHIMMKVILESSAFEDEDDLRRACQLAIACGSDSLKTSTGKHENGGATLETAAILMDEANNADRPIGVKISGGVKTPDDCAVYIALAESLHHPKMINPHTFRIGASGVLNALLISAGEIESPSMQENIAPEPNGY